MNVDDYPCPRCGRPSQLIEMERTRDSRERRYLFRHCHKSFRTHEGVVLAGRNWVRDALGEWQRADG